MHGFRFDGLDGAAPGSILRLESREETHLFRILRARPGDRVMLLDGHGTQGIAVVEPGMTLRLESCTVVPRPNRRIHLYFAPPRKQKLDVLLKQAVELGVWSLVPVLCERSVAVPGESAVSGRWTDLLFEACKQSCNPFLPAVSSPLPFRDALPRANDECSVMVVGSNRTGAPLTLTDTGDAAFFVGPEGGFTDAEMDALFTAGAKPLRIGGWTLRVETAAVAGLAVLNVLMNPSGGGEQSL